MTRHRSGVRTGSVNSHSTGMGGKPRRVRRALTARAHATSLWSMISDIAPDSQPSIADRLQQVRARIDAATLAAGRPAGSTGLGCCCTQHRGYRWEARQYCV